MWSCEHTGPARRPSMRRHFGSRHRSQPSKVCRCLQQISSTYGRRGAYNLDFFTANPNAPESKFGEFQKKEDMDPNDAVTCYGIRCRNMFRHLWQQGHFTKRWWNMLRHRCAKLPFCQKMMAHLTASDDVRCAIIVGVHIFVF